MDPLFMGTAAISLFSALMMVTRRNPVYSAIWLLICFMSIAVVFLQLAASFLAAIHVLVYTGAILVLFVFVIMLLNLKEEELGEENPFSTKALAATASTILFGLLSWPIWKSGAQGFPEIGPQTEIARQFGSVQNVGMLLFNRYGLAFEFVSVLIVVAMMGAVVLAKKKLWTTDAPPERIAG